MKFLISLSFYSLIISFLIQHQLSYASGTMSEKDISDVKKVDAVSEEDKKRLSIAAGLLANYEFAAKKLIDDLDNSNISAQVISHQANELLTLSESVISSAQFRLPQCKEYLEKTLVLKDHLDKISNETLEKDFHHDGALPKAPTECYHTKDLFVHPATVIVLTRDDPSLLDKTKSSINAEITEVLGHLELVRQLVIY
jgi:hypothetical protein